MTIVVNASGNNDIDGILWGWAWGDGGAESLTFSFPTSATGEYDDYAQVNNFSAFNTVQQTAARTALANISSFSLLTFTETTAAGAQLQHGEATSIQYTNDSDVAERDDLHNIGTAEGGAHV